MYDGAALPMTEMSVLKDLEDFLQGNGYLEEGESIAVVSKDTSKIREPKALTILAPDAHVQLNLPGGGGYGDPFQRPVELVFNDVVNGYVSLEAAEREYGVVIRYVGSQDQLVRPPELYVIDEAAPALRRRAAKRDNR